MSGTVLSPALTETTKIIVIAAFITTAAFAGWYVAKSNWRREPVALLILGDRVALAAIFAVVGTQVFWTFSVTTAIALGWTDVALIGVTILVNIASLVGMVIARRNYKIKKARDDAMRVKHEE